MKKLLTLLFFFSFGILFSQRNNFPDKYLPESIDDALDYMAFSWSTERKKEFKETNERDAVLDLHFTYGMAVRNGWIRHGNPKFKKNFNKRGVYALDDMSYVLLTAFHRKLNDKPLKLKQLIKPIRVRTLKEQKKYAAFLKSNFEKYKVNDTVSFKYLKTVIGNEPRDSLQFADCKPKAVILKKRRKDFNLNLKLISACVEDGIYILDKTSNDLKTINVKVEQKFWDGYWSWLANGVVEDLEF